VSGASGPPAAARPTGPSLPSRVLGLGSVFGKSFRDSRRTAIILGLVEALILLVTAASIAAEYDTVEKRLAIASQFALLPEILQGMLGQMINIERLGGFISWRQVNFVPVIFGIWSVVAMSGLLAGELARGSLDLLVVGQRGRARLALEKVGGYLLALGLVVAIFVIATEGVIVAFGTLPGDAVGLDAILAHAVWVYVASLAPGALAFAAAPIVGRGGALGVGGLTLFGSFIVSGYARSISFFERLEPLSYFSLTEGHRPLAGVEDWPAMLLVAGIVAALLLLGVLVFARRDLVVPLAGGARLPSFGFLVGGVYRRSLAERLPVALVWGAAIALYGLIVAASADEFVAALGSIPEIVRLIQQAFPEADIQSVGGFLQLAFFSEAILFVAVATAMLVGGWASDEGEQRLELVLSTPTTRSSWALRSALAAMTGIAVVAGLLVAGVVAGALTQAASRDVGQVAIGTSVLGLYAMALAGIGLGVGGLVRPGLAAPVTVALAFGFFLWELIGSIARFPRELLDLSLSRHLGQPLIGEYDWPGMALCAALAVGGVVAAMLGMRRRDIGR